MNTLLSFHIKTKMQLLFCPTSFMYTTTQMHPVSTSLTTPDHTTSQQPTTLQTPITPASTTMRTINTPTLSVTKHTSSTFPTSPPSTTRAQTENEIMKNAEHSIQKKIMFIDIKLQRNFIDFLMSPLGTKLSQNEIDSFFSLKQDLDFLIQINFVLSMINKKLRNSKYFTNQIDHLAELYCSLIKSM